MEEKDKNIQDTGMNLNGNSNITEETSSPENDFNANTEAESAEEEKQMTGESAAINEDQPKENKNIFGKKKKVTKKDKEKDTLEQMGQKLAEINDKYIRLAAEFDNYRKRTLKEKSDLLKYGAELALKNLLTVVDDFERALKSLDKTPDDDPVKAGIILITNKFKEYLTRQGIKEIDCTNSDFNVDEHEAITRFPAPSEDLKGKIIDVVEKGYLYHDKVIRFAKVVIGE